jgi:hypothetical protein
MRVHGRLSHPRRQSGETEMPRVRLQATTEVLFQQLHLIKACLGYALLQSYSLESTAWAPESSSARDLPTRKWMQTNPSFLKSAHCLSIALNALTPHRSVWNHFSYPVSFLRFSVFGLPLGSVTVLLVEYTALSLLRNDLTHKTTAVRLHDRSDTRSVLCHPLSLP